MEVISEMKASAKKQIVSAIFIASLVLMAYSVSAVSGADSPIAGVKPGQKLQWSVMASSGVTATWYSESFMSRGNYSVPVGSTISLTLTSVVGTAFRGNISIGSLVLTNMSMSEISFNLLLGWYPFFEPGLVCPINWDVQKQNATSNGFTVAESGTGPVHTITFTHLNGTVGTKLTYDEATGVLETGYGSFGQFLIEVVLMPWTSSEVTVAIAIAIVAIAVVTVAGWYGSIRDRRTSRHS
jgi:hypothetical protein